MYHTDFETRVWMVSELRSLAGLEGVQSCLELEEFLEVVEKVHDSHLTHRLDRHFLPQNLGCFFRTPVDMWSQIASIEEQDALAGLAERLVANSTVAPSEHSSTSTVMVSERSNQILDKITQNEYKLLGNHLHRPSRIKGGSVALLTVNHGVV